MHNAAFLEDRFPFHPTKRSEVHHQRHKPVVPVDYTLIEKVKLLFKSSGWGILNEMIVAKCIHGLLVSFGDEKCKFSARPFAAPTSALTSNKKNSDCCKRNDDKVIFNDNKNKLFHGECNAFQNKLQRGDSKLAN